MATLRYIKSFSKGQITIPKEIRDELGLGDSFWLKIFPKNGKIIAKPINKSNKKKISVDEWREKLLTMDTSWFTEKDVEQIRKNREQIEKRIRKNQL
ncbi:MAG: hypothetical protein US96_C0054G0012 [Candidatus Woesebacteria bacterium GW2011_GWB1_38_5b]|uniref:SpoVT-AbrB domain-containing protein n=1 Tax=Candidatus Woesebacteria bacterium GW2011_GWB1_38_5b TaxID=1618569 RepID=A0A0G0KE34_9BACT|nr:MAG: hypothetical protein US96_C0054G0012 [Candidatus Woesebacteria bacterium GW2011_GWB1_38_5b]